MTAPADLLAVARTAARAAGAHVLANLARRQDTDAVTRHDIKHKLDREAQDVAFGAIRAVFPDDALLGEESADAVLPPSTVRWVVDPIDGTVNFTHGLPLWCCAVAAQAGGRTVAGAVFAPEMGLCFEAQAGGPALCNGTALRVSDTDKLETALIFTSADKSDRSGQAFRFMHRVAEVAQRPRILGSAALDICFVAAGRADGYFEPGIFIWDLAAASLILERAGGRWEILREYPGHRLAVLASNGRLHEPLRAAILPLL